MSTGRAAIIITDGVLLGRSSLLKVAAGCLMPAQQDTLEILSRRQSACVSFCLPASSPASGRLDSQLLLTLV